MRHLLPPGGVDAYVSVPSKPYTAAVLIVSDVFGHKTDGVTRWADRLADAVRAAEHLVASSLRT